MCNKSLLVSHAFASQYEHKSYIGYNQKWVSNALCILIIVVNVVVVVVAFVAVVTFCCSLVAMNDIFHFVACL